MSNWPGMCRSLWGFSLSCYKLSWERCWAGHGPGCPWMLHPQVSDPTTNTSTPAPACPGTSSPQGVVALHHQPPERAVVPVPQRLCCPDRALDLADDVPGTPVRLLAQPAPGRCGDTRTPKAKPLQLGKEEQGRIPQPRFPAPSRCPVEQPEPREAPSPPSSSAMVASRRLALPSAAAASWHCRRRVGYSLPVSACRTLELVMRTAKLASVSGTGTVSRDLQRENSAGGAPVPADFSGEATWHVARASPGQSLRGLGFRLSNSLLPKY